MERKFEFSKEGLKHAIDYHGEVSYQYHRIRNHFERNKVTYRRIAIIAFFLAVEAFLIATTNPMFVVEPLAPVLDSTHAFRLYLNLMGL